MFDDAPKTWAASSGGGKFVARTLVLADGAQSKLARGLGIVEDGPKAICFCNYIIPGGKAVPSDLKTLHHGLLDENPILRRHLGSGYSIEPMKGAWLRLGGIPKSYADNLLIIGDAAGHIDPLTGEGIQFAMEGAEKAAETLVAAFRARRFDERFLQGYQEAWRNEFGNKFRLAEKASIAMARYPELVDSMARVANERDDAFFFAWADIMMGEAPWSDFLKPKLAVPLAVAALREIWTQRLSPRRRHIEATSG